MTQKAQQFLAITGTLGPRIIRY